VKKTTLTVPAGSARVEAFVAEARVSGRVTAELRIVEAGEVKVAENGDGDEAELASVPWNPLSFASARAAVIEAETALDGSIDELVVFADPPRDAVGIAESTPKAIERAALEWAAGYAELVREACRRFDEKGGGALVLVVVTSERGPLGAMAAGALLGLAEGMMAVGTGSVRFAAIRDESDQPDLLARQIVKTLGEPARDQGRILRFGGRSGFFGR
jgi:hypothetical protein